MLQIRDIGHLEKFKEFLRSDHTIIKNEERGWARLDISSNKLSKELQHFGVVPRKSGVSEVIGLEHDSHFWRGIIDGDGTIGIYKNSPYIYLCGSEILMNQFKKYIGAFVKNNSGRVTCHLNNTYQIAVYGKTASMLCYILYGNCNISLSRKHEKAIANIRRAA